MENEENKIIEEQTVEETKPEETVVPEEPKPEEVVEDEKVEDETEAVQEEVEKPETEQKEPEQEPKEEVDGSAEDNDNKDDEKESKADEEVVEEKEETPEPEQPKMTPEQAELLAQLEQLKAEKEIQQELRACNEQVMKVEREFNAITANISEKLKHSFQANDIDPTKTLEELRKENPAKATLAEQFIQQAQKIRDDLEKAATEEITKQQNKVIYKAAAIEFEKIGLNFEQATDAVKMFKKIVDDIGVADLEEDLKMKVQLAAGRAMLLKPKAKEQVPETKGDVDTGAPTGTEVPSGTTELEEASPEIEEVVEPEETKEEKEVPPAPVVEKPSVEDFEEGVTGSTSTASGSVISEFNVLEELAKLPYKEQRAFYKQHEDLISKALIKGQK